MAVPGIGVQKLDIIWEWSYTVKHLYLMVILFWCYWRSREKKAKIKKASKHQKAQENW